MENLKKVANLIKAIELPNGQFELHLSDGETRIVDSWLLDELVSIVNDYPQANDFYIHLLNGEIRTAVV